MVNKFDREEWRKRFSWLTAEREKQLAELVPYEQAREKLLESIQPRERELVATIKEKRKGLYEIDCERAAIARALNGKTG